MINSQIIEIILKVICKKMNSFFTLTGWVGKRAKWSWQTMNKGNGGKTKWWGQFLTYQLNIFLVKLTYTFLPTFFTLYIVSVLSSSISFPFPFAFSLCVRRISGLHRAALGAVPLRDCERRTNTWRVLNRTSYALFTWLSS